jgi:hypothetical protein
MGKTKTAFCSLNPIQEYKLFIDLPEIKPLQGIGLLVWSHNFRADIIVPAEKEKAKAGLWQLLFFSLHNHLPPGIDLHKV